MKIKVPKTQTARSSHAVGHLVAISKFARVTSVTPSEVWLHDVDDNSDFRVVGQELMSKLVSADLFEKEVKETLTNVAKLVSSSHGPITVCFEKQDGSERVLRGRLLSTEPLLGRSHFDDLDLDTNRLRLVDHRTIKYAIIDGVKYVVK